MAKKFRDWPLRWKLPIVAVAVDLCLAGALLWLERHSAVSWGEWAGLGYLLLHFPASFFWFVQSWYTNPGEFNLLMLITKVALFGQTFIVFRWLGMWRESKRLS